MKKIALLLIIIIIIIAFAICKDEHIKTIKSDRPFIELRVKADSTKIDPSVRNIIHLGNAKFDIPSNAIVDSMGNPVTDSVVLVYRDLADPVDFFIEGIPMNISESEYLVSTGMFDFRAYRKSEHLRLKENSVIDVELLSMYDNPNSETYFLDDNTKKWQKTGKELIRKETKQKLYSKLPPMPKPPELHISGDKLNISAKTIELFPNLAEYSNYEFKEIYKDFSILYWLTVSSIKNITIVENKIPGIYNFTIFYKDSSVEEAEAIRVFSDSLQYKEGVKEFKKKYGKQIDGIKKRKKQIEKEWQRDMKKYKKHINSLYKQNVTNKNIENINELIVRDFSIGRFGTWNCDAISRLQNKKQLQDIFSKKNTPKGIVSLNVLNLNENSILKYGCNTPLYYDSMAVNIVFGVCDDFSLYCSKIETTTDKPVFHNYPLETVSKDYIIKVLNKLVDENN